MAQVPSGSTQFHEHKRGVSKRRVGVKVFEDLGQFG